MKIIYSDNIPSDMSSESLWLDEIPDNHKETAQMVCDKLNEKLGDNQGSFFRIVPDNHELYKWEPLMRAHKLDAYIDGRKRIIFCSVCGQEDDQLGEECKGDFHHPRAAYLEFDVDKLKESS